MLQEFTISTQNRYQLVDITDKVEEVIRENEIKDGLVLILVPHSTAGIILTENEAGLKKDWLEIFKKLTSGVDFQHNKIDNNADSHVLSGLLGQGRTLAVANGKLIRGTWQQIFLAEFDGPRERRIIIKIVEE